MHWWGQKIIIYFVIWRENCTKIFREENKSPIALVREILLKYKNWLIDVIEFVRLCFILFPFI
jgi:hypothetical protein